MYNAHLDVVHASIAEHGKKAKMPNGDRTGNGPSKIQGDKPKYRQIAPAQYEKLSAAEQSAMNTRVSLPPLTAWWSPS